MTRAVRLDPVPPPPPPRAVRPRRRGHGVLAAALIVLGAAAYAAHVVLAGLGHHAWDRNASPGPSVTVVAGTSYTVSTAAGPTAPAAGSLACRYRLLDAGGDGSEQVLTVAPVGSGSRATHAVATFAAPVSGRIAVGCTGGPVGDRPVFVDGHGAGGADGAGVALLLAIVLLLPGVGLALGAAHARFGRPADPVPTG